MDFDTEVSKFLSSSDMKRAVRHFVVQETRNGSLQGVQAQKEAERWAEIARNEIVSALPSSLTTGSNRPITQRDLLIHFSGLSNDGIYTFELSWNPDAVRRRSLCDDEYPDGIEDIVALFASGYHARNYAYGWWSGHSGGNYRGGTASNGAYVRSLKDRPKSFFIRDAVLAFNTAHHMDGAEITIDPAAKDYM